MVDVLPKVDVVFELLPEDIRHIYAFYMWIVVVPDPVCSLTGAKSWSKTPFIYGSSVYRQKDLTVYANGL